VGKEEARGESVSWGEKGGKVNFLPLNEAWKLNSGAKIKGRNRVRAKEKEKKSGAGERREKKEQHLLVAREAKKLPSPTLRNKRG